MPDTYTCPRCGRTSHHPEDARYRHCVACHTFGDPCAVCGAEPAVGINGQWFCSGHIDDGFSLTLRGLAVLRGADDDQADAIERIGGELLTALEASRREGLI